MNQEELEQFKRWYGASRNVMRLITEVERLQAEIERLKPYTADPKLFAAACGVLQTWDEYSPNDYRGFIEAMEDGGLYDQLSEAVAWWDSLPQPAQMEPILPPYEG